MNDQNLSTTPPADQPPTDSRAAHRAERAEWREQRRTWRRSGGGAWLGGLILIALGVIFLLQNFSGFHFNNWWALFILIPAISSLSSAWYFYRQAGRLNRSARGALFSGLVLLLITATFLFELNWNLVLPLLLIALGLGLLINTLLPD
jgi:cation transport ATPase